MHIKNFLQCDKLKLNELIKWNVTPKKLVKFFDELKEDKQNNVYQFGCINENQESIFV